MLPGTNPTPSASSISPTTVYGITPTAFPTYPSHLYRPQATETSAWDTLWRSPKSFSHLLIFIPLFLGTISGVGLKVTLPKFAPSRVEKLKMQQFDDEGVWGEDWDNASESDSRAGWICLCWHRDGNEGVQTAVDAWVEKWDATVARDWNDWIRGFLGGIVNQRCEFGWELLRITGAAGSSTIRCERCR